MHYAVSHGNFDVVSILLDSKVCDINQLNKAGYTSVMLVSLAEICSPTHANVVRRLFHLGDVNIRAKEVCVVFCIQLIHKLIVCYISAWTNSFNACCKSWSFRYGANVIGSRC